MSDFTDKPEDQLPTMMTPPPAPPPAPEPAAPPPLPEAERAAPPPPVASYDAGFGEPLTPQPPKDNRNRNIIIGIVVALVVILCCCCIVVFGGIYWLWNNGDQYVEFTLRQVLPLLI